MKIKKNNEWHQAFSENSSTKFLQISLKQIEENFVFKKLLENWGVLGKCAVNGCFKYRKEKEISNPTHGTILQI